MPTRSQRHKTELQGGTISLPAPAALSSVANVATDGLGKVQVNITSTNDRYLSTVNMYLAPTGVPLDKLVHQKRSFPAQVNNTFSAMWGDPNLVNVAAGAAQIGRQWSLAAGKYTHGATNLDNRVMTSLDGINWSSGTVPTDATPQTWETICWSPELNLFCAIASSGGTVTTQRCMTSPDGINWTVRVIGTQAWRGICWGGAVGQRKFVAVSTTAATTNIYYSADGITWLAGPTKGNTNQVRAVCWSPELSLFVAVCDTGTGNRAFTSPDGLNWTVRTTPQDNTWLDVCWSAERGLFVAVASSGTNRIMTSPDGINWTVRDSGNDAGGAWTSICWSKEAGKFIIVATSGSTGARSSSSLDGINWSTAGQNIAGQTWTDVLWVAELGFFVACNGNATSARIATSVDGVNWVNRTNMPSGPVWAELAWSPALGKLVGVANTNGVNAEKLWWPAIARAGDNWRFGATVSDGTTLGTSGAISTTFGNPSYESFTLTNSFGNAARKRVSTPAVDEGLVGFAVSTDAAVAISQLAIFKENALCAPQGAWDIYVCPVNASGVEGPPSAAVVNVVVI